MAIQLKKARGGWQHGRLREAQNCWVVCRFMAEPDLDDKGRWCFPIEWYDAEGGALVAADSAVIKLYYSQLGDLKPDFEAEQLWKPGSPAYRLGVKEFTWPSGKHGYHVRVGHRYKLLSEISGQIDTDRDGIAPPDPPAPPPRQGAGPLSPRPPAQPETAASVSADRPAAIAHPVGTRQQQEAEQGAKPCPHMWVTTTCNQTLCDECGKELSWVDGRWQ